MMKFTIKSSKVAAINEADVFVGPKYTSQLINLANQNAQGTRPATVGQMSELFVEFMQSQDNVTIDNWETWYKQRYPEAIDEATEKICNQVRNLQNAITLIDESMVRNWVEDLVINKTFNGLYVQRAILASLAERKKTTYRLATPCEESRGIDGFVGDSPYSIKPTTYKTMERLSEEINVKIVYYEKTKAGIRVEFDE